MAKSRISGENPFAFEKNHKLFVQQLERTRTEKKTQKPEPQEKQTPHERLYANNEKAKNYGMIRALEDETLKLAKDRDEQFSRDPNLDLLYGGKTMKLPSVNSKLWESEDSEKKKKDYKIRNLLKEKKETLDGFVKKKREIFLANMNINIKKEETNRLEDYIKNEEESLKARELDIRNDWELVKNFMGSVREQADKAQQEAEREAKKKDKKNHKIQTLINDIEKLKALAEKEQEILDNLKEYKNFVDKIGKRSTGVYVSEAKKEALSKEPMFVTEPENIQGNKTKAQGSATNGNAEEKQENSEEFLIPFQDPQDIIEILNEIETQNLYYIQNKHKSQEDLEKIEKQLKELTIQYETKRKDNYEKINALQKTKEQLIKKRIKLEGIKLFDRNKVEISDGDNIDMALIGKEVFKIFKDLSKDARFMNSNLDKNFEKGSLKHEIESWEMRNYIETIESTLTKLLRSRKTYEENDFINKNFLSKTEKTLKDDEIKRKKDEEMRVAALKDKEYKEAKLRKKMQAQSNLRKGRKAMVRKYFEKEKEEKVEVELDENDNDEKYLRESFDLGSDLNFEKKLQTKKKSPQKLNH